MRKRTKVFVGFLVLLFVLACVPTFGVQAQSTPNDLIKEQRKKLPEDIVNFLETHSQESEADDERITMIVELQELAEMQGGQDEEVVVASQSDVKQEIQNRIEGVTFRRSFGYLLNGFSIVTERKNLPYIQTIPGVARVKEAELFYPTMSTSVELTEGSKVWKKYNQTGEGMLVSVIDTGVDHNHPDMRLDDGVKVKLTKADVAKMTDLEGTWKSDKIPYGYNYADMHDDSRNMSQDHGLHVAGIIGANAVEKTDPTKGIVGEAPNCQILAMKVFSDYAGGAASDDIIAAIEDSVKLGADVINMSLGSAGGFYDNDTAYARAINEATESGCLVVCAAGNEGSSGDAQGGDGNLVGILSDGDDLIGRDTGIVGSPSTVVNALSVASAENSQIMESAFYINKQSEENLRSWKRQDTPAPVADFIEVVECGLGGELADFPAEVKGKYALIKRGEFTFEDKAKNAKASGAIGALIYNADDSPIANMGGVDKVGLFVAGLTNETGLELLDQIKQDGSVKVKFTLDPCIAENAYAGEMSSFSSWGPTPELGFKPEITAPGGNIYSTTAHDTRGNMSGTSMASPNAAGVAALVGAQLRKDGIELTGEEFALFMKKTLINTADPLIVNDVPVSPRKQGAGMVQAEKAVRNRVLATVDGNAAVSLKDIQDTTTFTAVLKNYADKAVKFTVDPGTVYVEGDEVEMFDVAATEATLIADTGVVEVPANGEVTVTFTLNPAGIDKNWAEGFIKFVSEDATVQPDLVMPYFAYVGDWGADFQILDKVQNDGAVSTYAMLMNAFGNEELKGRTALMSELQILWFSFQLPLGELSSVSPRSKTIGFGPKGNSMFSKAYAQIGTHRAAEELEVYVSENADPEAPTARRLMVDEKVGKVSLANLLTGRRSLYSENKWYFWNGEFYDETTGVFEPAEEGQYYFHVRARKDADSPWQTRTMPIYLDNTAPEVELTKVEWSQDIDTQTYTALVEITANDAGIGTDENMFTVYLNDDLLKQSEGKYDIYVKDAEAGIYELVIPNFDPEKPASLEVMVEDYARNHKTVKREIGAQTYIMLEEEHFWKDEWLTIYGDMFINEDDLEQDYWSDQPVMNILVSHSPDIAKVYINDKLVQEDVFGDLIYELIPVEGDNILNVRGVDANDQVVMEIDNYANLHYYNGAPDAVITDPMPEPYVDATTGESYGDIAFIPVTTDQTEVEITGTVNDKFSNFEDIKGSLKVEGVDGNFAVTIKDDNTFTVTAPLALHKIYAFSFENKHGNRATVQFRIFDETEYDDVAEILKPDEPEPDPDPTPDPDPGVDPDVPVINIPKISFKKNPTGLEFSDFMIINKKIEASEEDGNLEDELIIVGTGNNIRKLEIGGKEVKLVEEGDKPGEKQSFETKVLLHSGMNDVSVKVFRDPLDDEVGPQLWQGRKYQVLYDFTAPGLQVNITPQPFERTDEDMPVIYTNNGDVHLEGTVWDDTFGYDLFINGDHIVKWLDITEAGEDVTKKAFSYDTNIVNNGILSIDLIDAFGHSIEQKYKVIYDTIAPTIKVVAPEFGEEINYKDGEKIPVELSATAVDDRDDPVTITMYLNGKEYNGEKVTEPGTYIFRVVAVDSAGNMSEHVRIFYIVNEKPLLTVVPDTVTITAGDSFDPMEGVRATDKEDGNLTDKVTYTKTYNTDVAGKYAIVYTVADELGEEATAVRTLIVEAKDEPVVLQGWHVIDNKQRYYVNGEYLTGRHKVGKTIYLFAADGDKQYGWHRLKGEDYYFDPVTGGMLTGKRTIGKTTYLLTAQGKKTGWLVSYGKKYYFDPNFGGGMVTGLRTAGSSAKYYFRTDDSVPGANDRGSALVSTSITVNGKTYTMNANGAVIKVE